MIRSLSLALVLGITMCVVMSVARAQMNVPCNQKVASGQLPCSGEKSCSGYPTNTYSWSDENGSGSMVYCDNGTGFNANVVGIQNIQSLATGCLGRGTALSDHCIPYTNCKCAEKWTCVGTFDGCQPDKPVLDPQGRPVILYKDCTGPASCSLNPTSGTGGTTTPGGGTTTTSH